jgi:F-type H+-transporting ATPase subunit epsilon
MTITVQVDIVSVEAHIFSGLAERVVATGALGELGILPGHSPLLTSLKPGPVRIIKTEGDEEVFYIKGGVLEVQPRIITILAETAVRAADLDEEAALEAKQQAEQALKDRKSEIDFAKASGELAQAMAQLASIRKLKKQLKIE